MINEEDVFKAGQRARRNGFESHDYPLFYELTQVRIWRSGWAETPAKP